MVKAVIESGLKYALNKQLISYNPSIGVKISKTLIAKNREQKLEKTKTLTEEQLKLLIEKSKGTSIYMQVLFSGFMGLRVSEVNGIKYTDVDFVNRKLKVQRQLGVVANSNKEDYAIRTYTKQEIPVKSFSSIKDLTKQGIEINNFINNEINELTKNEIKIVNATNNSSEEIINEYFSELIS